VPPLATWPLKSPVSEEFLQLPGNGEREDLVRRQEGAESFATQVLERREDPGSTPELDMAIPGPATGPKPAVSTGVEGDSGKLSYPQISRACGNQAFPTPPGKPRSCRADAELWEEGAAPSFSALPSRVHTPWQ